jgi:hypothetical protein
MRIQLYTDDGKLVYDKELIKDTLIDIHDKNFIQKHLTSFMDILERAIRLFITRFDEYGESWEMPEFPNYEVLLNALVCMTKSKRICNMLDKDKGKPNKHAELIVRNTFDLILYSNFLLQSIKKQKEGDNNV